MTTAETTALMNRFSGMAQLAKAAGDHAGARAFFRAAELLSEAESASIVASFDRGQKRRKSLGLRLTR
jgi:hypothetical protein